MAKKVAGLSQIKKGFCFDEAGDEAFALGWPHVRRITDDDVDGYRLAAQRLMDSEFDLSIHWPRSAATALVHAWGSGQLFDLAPGNREFRTTTREAMWNTLAPNQEQVRGYLSERMLRTPMWASDRATESFVLMLEALTDTESVADAIVSQLERLDRGELHEAAGQPAIITYQLGYLLLRVETSVAEALRARMRVVLEQNAGVFEGSSRRVAPHASHARSLSLILGGAQAADRTTDKDLRWYTHAVADAHAVRVRASVNKSPSLPDARLVWIGGPEVLTTPFVKRWAQLPPRDQRWFFESIAPIQHPEVVSLVVTMRKTGTGLNPRASEWLQTHRTYAEPVLKKLAGSSADAREALALW
jgi:hypothetical protein